ncbi:MAG: translation initiation factor IF-2 [Candidatus Melainabacteria bacterium]
MSQSKVRIYELAKVLDVPSKDIMDLLEKDHGTRVKSHSSTIDQHVADKIVAHFKGEGKVAKAAAKEAAKTADAKTARPDEKSMPVLSEPDNENQLPQRYRNVRVIKRQTIEDAKAATPEPPAEEVKPAEPEQPYLKPGTIIHRAEPDRPRQQPAAEKPETEKPVDETPEAAAEREKLLLQPAPQGEGWEKRKDAKGGVKHKKPAPKVDLRREIAQAEAAYFTKEQELASLHKAAANLQRQAPPKAPQSRIPIPASRKKSKKTKRQLYEERMEQQRLIQEAEEELLTAPKIVSIAQPMTVAELARAVRIKETELIKHLFMQGRMVTVNQIIDVETARTIAKDFEFEIIEETEAAKSTRTDEQYEAIASEPRKKLDKTQFLNLETRAPVVSIMGHVDHGKTTLLDAIRETRHKIVDTEAGGITQSIGAYTVEKNGKRIVFLDTPGHEAFTAMRMRGARSTDIAILVVAADDGVMPQTIEAINHAKAAQIPIIVAVNKIDKDDANPDNVLSQLTEYGLSSEKWGGETLTNELSALQKVGLEELLDNILLVSELLDLKADPTVPGQGVVVESQLDKRMGPVATILVQNGTLAVGDNILIGAVGGRVRALIDDSGNRIQEAGPSTPVEVLGLDSVPNAGDEFIVIRDDKQYKQRLQAEKNNERDQRLSTRRSTLTAGFGVMNDDGRPIHEKQFNIIIKADTQGSLEAVSDMLAQLSTDEIKVNILHQATGDISEADVMLAVPSNAIIVGFNTKPDNNAERLSEQHGVTIRTFDIIYQIAEEVEKRMLGKLSPEIQELESGAAEVRQLFSIGKTVIAGCMVTEGKLIRNAKATVLRDGEVLHTGVLSQLKRFKDDVREVASGYECGISFEKFNDLQPGDTIKVFVTKELERTSL